MKKILVVEDDNITRRLISSMITQMGYMAAESTNGKSALLALNRDPDISLVITDIVMPEMDGIALIKTLRRKKRFKRLPVIVISGIIKKDSISEVLDMPETEFVEKPLLWREMKEYIQKHIGTPAAAMAPIEGR